MKKAEQTRAVIENFYDAFNAKDWDRFFTCVDEHLVHDVPGGGREKGKAAFRAHIAHKSECYDEQVENIDIVIEAPGDEAEVEFDLVGTYIKQDGTHPPATGQTYRLSVGAFVTVKGGKVIRLSTFHDAQDWLRQLKS